MVVYGEKTSQRPFYGEIIENLSRSTLRKRSKKYNGTFMEKRHLTCLLLEREDLYKAFPRLLKGNPCKFFSGENICDSPILGEENFYRSSVESRKLIFSSTERW